MSADNKLPLCVIRQIASGWKREAPGAVDSRFRGNDVYAGSKGVGDALARLINAAGD